MWADTSEKKCLLWPAGGGVSATPQLPTSKFCNTFLVTLAMVIPFLQPGRRFPPHLFTAKPGTTTLGCQTLSEFFSPCPSSATPADYHTPVKQHFITSGADGTALTRRAPVRWDSRQHWLLFSGKIIGLQALICSWSFLGIVWGRRDFWNCRGLYHFSLLSLSTLWSELLCHIVFLPSGPQSCLWRPQYQGMGFSSSLFSLLPGCP